MEVVAERQGHFEFEKRGLQRYPVYEMVLMQDEMTGEEYVEERPKLAVPEVSLVQLVRDEPGTLSSEPTQVEGCSMNVRIRPIPVLPASAVLLAAWPATRPSAQQVPPVEIDHRDLQAQLCRPDGADIATRSGADDGDVKLFSHVSSSCCSAAAAGHRNDCSHHIG